MSDVARQTTGDAVIVVPGIMGSELEDAYSGRLIWGLRDPLWYARIWTSPGALARVALSPDELAGRYGRVRATGLLRFPAFAPMLRGIEPYTRLVERLRAVTAHPDAVLEFPYDWRLPVANNASRLARAVEEHLARWRSHPAQREHRLSRHGEEPRVVVVAHSMGGLLARAMGSGCGADIRMVITLGTPFFGSVKAAVILASGRGAPIPLPRRQLHALAVTLPAVYDLLPAFRCVDTGASARQLTAEDVVAFGGDPGLAQQAVGARPTGDALGPDRYVHIVGANQPTAQSLTLTDGTVTSHEYTCSPLHDGRMERLDLAGDGTVHRQSAHLPGSRPQPLPQSHGAIARSEEALVMVTDALLDRGTGPWLGAAELGLDLPDVVSAGQPCRITVRGADHPRDAQCSIVEVASGRVVAVPPTVRADGAVAADAVLATPGLYRVAVAGGGTSPVSELLLVVDPGEDASGSSGS